MTAEQVSETRSEGVQTGRLATINYNEDGVEYLTTLPRDRRVQGVENHEVLSGILSRAGFAGRLNYFTTPAGGSSLDVKPRTILFVNEQAEYGLVVTRLTNRFGGPTIVLKLIPDNTWSRTVFRRRIVKT